MCWREGRGGLGEGKEGEEQRGRGGGCGCFLRVDGLPLHVRACVISVHAYLPCTLFPGSIFPAAVCVCMRVCVRVPMPWLYRRQPFEHAFVRMNVCERGCSGRSIIAESLSYRRERTYVHTDTRIIASIRAHKQTNKTEHASSHAYIHIYMRKTVLRNRRPFDHVHKTRKQPP